MTDVLLTIDPAQLRRIEATHGGFLYQHLIGVACTLLVRAGRCQALVVERDEDLELEMADDHWYLQVKNYSALLQPSDIKGALERFVALRKLHADGTRPGSAKFFIVSSSGPSPKLEKQLEVAGWPSDVEFVCPTRPSSTLGIEIREDVASQWRAVVDAMGTVPLTGATPSTLTWKLTAVVQALATGAFGDGQHRLRAAEVPSMLEQVVALMDELPPPPDDYRPQVAEPELVGTARVRLISGTGGKGKTAWAAQAAVHAPMQVIYARAMEADGSEFASWIASHVASNMMGDDRDAVVDVFRPGTAGAEALRALDQRLGDQHGEVLVIVDDAHHLDDDQVAVAIQATSRLRWLLIGRPGQAMSGVAARLVVGIELLSGWSDETVAVVMDARGVRCDPQSAHEARETTGGAPLFVNNIARLAASEGQSLAEYIKAFREGSHGQTTSLERLLQRDVVAHLPVLGRHLLAVLTFMRAPLARRTILDLVLALDEVSTAKAGSAVRALVDWDVIRAVGGGGYTLHDTFRPIGVQLREDLSQEQLTTATAFLKAHLDSRLRGGTGSMSHMVDYMRTLGELGELDVLADIASGWEELFREHGLSGDVRSIIDAAVSSAGKGTPEGRFLAFDSLAFFALQDGDRDSAERWIARQQDELDRMAGADPDHAGRLATKHMLMALQDEDLDAAEQLMAETFAWMDWRSEGGRVLRYNFALVAMNAGRLDLVIRSLYGMTDAYLGDLGLERHQVYRANPQDILGLVGDGEHQDRFRHLADCLFLEGRVAIAGEVPVELEFLWAMKFYDLANAPASAVKAAFEHADQLLWSFQQSDPQRSVEFFERNLLPALDNAGLFRQTIEVWTLYAVALACVARFQEADAWLRRVGPYVSGMCPQDLAVLHRRADMVSALASGEVSHWRGHLVNRRGIPQFQEPILPVR